MNKRGTMPARTTHTTRTGLRHSMSRVILRHIFSGLSRRPVKNRAILRVEGLEERRNPVTATWDGGTGILDVQGTGTGLNDRILVIQNGSGISVFNQITNQFVP